MALSRSPILDRSQLASMARKSGDGTRSIGFWGSFRPFARGKGSWSRTSSWTNHRKNVFSSL